jgi:hypothetical protein
MDDELSMEAMNMPPIADYLLRMLITMLVVVLAVEGLAAAFVLIRDLFHDRHQHAGNPGASPA